MGHTFVGWWRNDKLIISRGFYSNTQLKLEAYGNGFLLDDSKFILSKRYDQEAVFSVSKKQWEDTLKYIPDYKYDYLASNCAKYASDIAYMLDLDIPNFKLRTTMIETIPVLFISYLKQNNATLDPISDKIIDKNKKTYNLKDDKVVLNKEKKRKIEDYFNLNLGFSVSFALNKNKILEAAILNDNKKAKKAYDKNQMDNIYLLSLQFGFRPVTNMTIGIDTGLSFYYLKSRFTDIKGYIFTMPLRLYLGYDMHKMFNFSFLYGANFTFLNATLKDYFQNSYTKISMDIGLRFTFVFISLDYIAYLDLNNLSNTKHRIGLGLNFGIL